MGEFGEKLRKQREQRGITLESVSNTTKIGTRMLKALEDERFDQLPGGVFNKGFVRAYARQIGLDAEEAVTGYLAALRESQAQAHAIMPEFRPPREAVELPRPNVPPVIEIPAHVPERNELRAYTSPKPAPVVIRDQPAPAQTPEPQIQKSSETTVKDLPLRKLIDERPARPNLEPRKPIPWGIVAAALLVVALLLALLSFRPKSTQSATAHSASSTSEPSAPTVASAKPASPNIVSAPDTHFTPSAPPASSAPKPLPSSSASSAGAAQPLATSGPPLTASGVTSGPSPKTTPPSASSGTPSGVAESNPKLSPAPSSSPVIPTTAPAKSSAPRLKPPAPFTLQIRAEETSWISITADGKPVAQETLIAPAGTSVRATQEIVVRTGNPSGLVFVLNGKTLPRQGAPGEPQTLTFDATGVKSGVLPATTP